MVCIYEKKLPVEIRDCQTDVKPDFNNYKYFVKCINCYQFEWFWGFYSMEISRIYEMGMLHSFRKKPSFI